MRIGFKSGIKFKSTDFAESSEKLPNPGCGWYHVYTFAPKLLEKSRPVEEEVWLDEACRAEQLALVLIDIGAFRACELSADALSYIRQIFLFFKKEEKQMILRFTYDAEGRGMVREPFALSVVKKHMEQAGSVIREFAEDILVVQGIFVGNWGEMHGSRFLEEETMCELVNTLYQATDGRCFLAVRTPAQWRKIVGSKALDAKLEERLTLFNDGLFGSPTDLGTYGTQRREKAGEKKEWCRKDELDWQERRLASVPVGGEALPGMAVGFRQAAEEMEKLHLCYLNGIYHSDVLERWKKERVKSHDCFDNMSGYDYIGCHLGYRFVVRSAAERKDHVLQVEVENCGFSNLLEEAECFLELEEPDKRVSRLLLDTDARRWRSKEKTLLQVSLSALEKSFGDYRTVCLSLRRKRDGRALIFANQGAGERILLGHIE